MLSNKIKIFETTKEKRKSIAEGALALASLSGYESDDFVKNLFQKYIDGQIELAEIERLTVQRFTEDSGEST